MQILSKAEDGQDNSRFSNQGRLLYLLHLLQAENLVVLSVICVQPGFGAFHADFLIIRGMVAPGKEEIVSAFFLLL